MTRFDETILLNLPFWVQLNEKLTVREDDSIVTQRVTVQWDEGEAHSGDGGTSDTRCLAHIAQCRISEPRFCLRQGLWLTRGNSFQVTGLCSDVRSRSRCFSLSSRRFLRLLSELPFHWLQSFSACFCAPVLAAPAKSPAGPPHPLLFSLRFCSPSLSCHCRTWFACLDQDLCTR